jgi:hypothetical protein
MYFLDDEQVDVLKAQPATKMQVTTTQGDFDVTIAPSRMNQIQFALNCV